MNIEEIDIVAFDEKINRVFLIAVDDLNWSDVDAHLGFLQEKILSYVNYIENGEFAKKYSSKIGMDIEIKVVFEHDPPEEGERFMKQAMLILEETSFKLSFCTYDGDA